ncbi:type II toxin-antitoxin system VapC family toxin [Candidatus Pacearchaeota archaeon]|nr:type II toxin-antitoxin system VapC family toxin [Candidatus Pacearchaeota archaeon]
MENSICIDSDILIDFLRGKPETVKWINENEEYYAFAITTINAFELYSGAYKSNNPSQKLKIINDLIDRLKILNFSLEIAEKAGKQFSQLEDQGEIIEIRDLFIGMIALCEGFSIKTNNSKHFSRIAGLNIIN